YLLDDYSLKIRDGKIKKDELENIIRQKPNRKILGFRFHLGLYNLSDLTKDGWFHRTLRKIGEEPVIYDEFLEEKTASQLKLYLQNKGYYNASVEDSVILKNQKAKIIYKLSPKEAYRIREVSYEFEDQDLRDLVLSDTINSLLNENDHFDVDVLSRERERIETLLKNHGYYYFNKEYIFYEADTTLSHHSVNIKLIIKKYLRPDNEEGYIEVSHPKVRIGDVFLHTEFDSRMALSNLQDYEIYTDTVNIGSIYLLYRDKLKIKPGVLTESNYIVPGELYNLDNVRKTYRNLSSLRLFRLVNIEFRDRDSINSQGQTVLDCEIFLTPQTLQSYAVELQGTNSSGNIGAAGNVIYQHRNLFQGAENLSLSLTGALEALEENYPSDYGYMVEFGSEVRLRIPKFFLPFKTDQFIKKYNPNTSISAAYNYQRRPDYTRTVANASFGYNWRANRHLTHIINPVELNLVSIPYKSQEFSEWLEGKYIFYSYQPHLVTVTNYSLIFNNQNIKKKSDFTYFRMNLESAGNLLSTSFDLAGVEKKNGSYELFNTESAQYIRGDFDFRYYNVLDKNSSLVYRVFAGAGLPYQNSTALPFEKKYFGGGANGIRAWQVRNLGPGSYDEEEELTYPNKTADIKLEANIEYRFKLFWVLEGALFLDAGNIWAINENDERTGALFKPESFYKDIAVGTGFGTRFVFSFFTFRLDLGIKTRNPVLPEGKKWTFGTSRMTSDDFTLNIGIGYPF
ncbi:MAG: BamA/TamA family outer membrane protein, partial [Bacteroidota bacterium]